MVLFVATLGGVYVLGLQRGYRTATRDVEVQLATIIEELEEEYLAPPLSPAPIPKPTQETRRVVREASWGGPELWSAVNKRREEFGVNPLTSADELCTVASIRLNEMLVLGRLDNHEGFSNMYERRSDLAWIFDKYSTVAEFLAMGGQTAEETVSLWENTLGHKKLLTGGEYVWGCIYAQNTFAVAITAF